MEVRTGYCRRGCGACCESMILPLDLRIIQTPKFHDWRKWARLHGVDIKLRSWDKQTVSDVLAFVPLSCAMLDSDTKDCIVYDHRPEMCRKGPVSLQEVELWGLEDVCTYKFEEATDGRC